MVELRNKKAAFEMSMSTIVIIVLAVVFLILGLVLLKNIFGVATKSIGDVDNKLQDQLNSLFAQEDNPVWIKPEDGVLRIRAGTTNFGFVLGGRSKYGADVSRGDIQYRLILDNTSPANCLKKLNEAKIKTWFPNSKISSSENDLANLNKLNFYKTDLGWGRIQVQIPSGTVLCTQDVYYDIYDVSDNSTLPMAIGGGAFTIEVLRKSLV